MERRGKVGMTGEIGTTGGIKPPDWKRCRRRAGAQTAGREMQPEARAVFSVGLAEGARGSGRESE